MKQTFLNKLKERRIWKTIVAYPAASFVILQAVDFFISKYGLTPLALNFTLILLLGGFIIALIWNWNHGEIGHQNFTKKESWAYSVISLLTVVSAFYLSSQGGNDQENVFAVAEDKIYKLAVLPFESTSEDESTNYLSEGIPENLINRLSLSTNLTVLSRASTFILNTAQRNAETVQSKLNADLMLTGRIDRIADRLVVNCQLIDTKSKAQIWGEKIAYESKDIIELEEYMVSSLVNALPNTFKKEDLKSVKSSSSNSEAQAHYMKGRALTYGSTQEQAEKALDHFREAVKIDPQFVAAYVAIGNEKMVQAMFATDTRDHIFNEARMAVQTALTVDPNYSEAYTLDGAIKFYGDADWQGAEESYKKALSLNPKNVNALIRYSAFLSIMRRHDEALKYGQQAVVLDPISISSLHNMGWISLLSGNYKVAENAFSEALAIHPNWIWGYIKRGYSYALSGQCKNGLKDHEKARDLLNGEWGSELIEAAMIWLLNQCEYNDLKDAAISKYLNEFNSSNYKDPMAMSMVYMCKDDKDEALNWIEKGIEEKATGLYQINVDFGTPTRIKNSPEFKKIRRDLKFPQ